MIYGYDVSKWQAPSLWNWTALRDAPDVQFMIARASYGAHGPNRKDPVFESYAHSVRGSGLKFGAYHFFRQDHSHAGQADLFLSQLTAVDYGPGDLVPVLDLEDNSDNGDGPPRPTLFNGGAQYMIKRLLEAGYPDVMIYTSPSFVREHLGTLEDRAWLQERPVWWAHWTQQPGTLTVPQDQPLSNTVMHQYAVKRSQYFEGEQVDHNVAWGHTLQRIVIPPPPDTALLDKLTDLQVMAAQVEEKAIATRQMAAEIRSEVAGKALK